MYLITGGSTVDPEQYLPPPKIKEDEELKDDSRLAEDKAVVEEKPALEEKPAIEQKTQSAELTELKKTLESNRPGSNPGKVGGAEPDTVSDLSRKVFDLTKTAWDFFGGSEPESKLETNDPSSQLTDNAKLSLKLISTFAGASLSSQIGGLMLPKQASNTMIDVASKAITGLVANFPGSKVNLLDSYLGSLETLRDQNEQNSKTTLSSSELKQNHKQIIESLVASQLPEGKSSLAGLTADLLIHAKDKDATQANERQDLIQSLIDASGGESVNYGEILKKADLSLSHLPQEDLATLYSGLIEKGIDASGLIDQAAASLSGLDLTEKEREALKESSVKALSTALGDVFSRLDTDGKKSVFDLATDIFAPENKDKLSALLQDPTALFADPESFGLTQEKLDDAEIALTNAGLDYLQDKIGLNQTEVDQLSNVYKLGKELAGKDGVFNQDDVATLAATLGVNDLDTLKDAKSMIQDQIMGTITQEAFAEAERQIKVNPEFARIGELLGAPARIRDGIGEYNSGRSQRNAGAAKLADGINQRNRHPILADLFANASSRIAQGRSQLAHADSRLAGGENQIFSGVNQYNAGVNTLENGKAQGRSLARDAINLLGNQVNGILDPLTRAGASVEVSRQLRQQLQNDPKQALTAPSPQETNAALSFFRELSAKPLNEIDSSVLKEAAEHHENLTTQALKSHLEAGIDRNSRSLSEQTKASFRGIEKFLSIAANRDIRSGITQENLKAAQASPTVINGLVDKFEKAYGLETGLDAQSMMQKYKNGELSLSELPETLTKQINSGSQNESVDIASRLLQGDANKEFFTSLDESKGAAAEHLKSRGIAGFKVGDQEYLGYAAKDSNGNTRRAYALKSGDQISYKYMDSDPKILAAYQKALGVEEPQVQKQAPVDSSKEALIDEYVKKGLIRQEELNDSSKEFKVFEFQGQKFLGLNDHYNAPTGKTNRPAYIMPDGIRMGIAGHAGKLSAYKSALASQDDIKTSQVPADNQNAVNIDVKLKIDESLLRDDGLSFSQKIANEFLSKEKNTDYHAAIAEGKLDDASQILKDRNISGFRMNGNDYIGYIAPNGKPAYQGLNEKGELKAFYIQDQAMMSALYGAMMRDGIDSSGVEAFSGLTPSIQSVANKIDVDSKTELAQPSSGPGSFDSLPSLSPINAWKDGSGYIHSNITGGSNVYSNGSNNSAQSNQSSHSRASKPRGYGQTRIRNR